MKLENILTLIRRTGAIPMVVRLLGAVAVVLLAFFLRQALAHGSLKFPPYVTFYPAIVLVALLGDFWAGILATALSVILADYFMLSPIGRLNITDTADITGIVLFSISGIAISAAMAAYRRNSERLAAYKVEVAVLTERKQAEEALRQNQELLRVTLGSIGDAVLATNTEGRITFLNPVAAALTGWSADEAQGRPAQEVFRIINEKTRASAEDIVARVLREERAAELANHTAVVAKNGAVTPIEDSAAPIRNSAGEVIGVVLVFRDVTVRRRAQETQQYLSAIVESSDDAIIGESLDGLITSWNFGATRLYGYTAPETIGKPISMLVPVDRQKEAQDFLERVSAGVRVHHYESIRQRKDGSSLDVSLTISPIFDATGKIVGASTVARDITERKRAEDALLRAEIERKSAELAHAERKRLFDVLETLPAMICLLTPDYHVAFANRSFREKFGESQGRRCYEYCFGRTEPCEFCESYEVLKTGQPHQWEVAAPDGSVISAYDFPFTDVDGSPLILEMDIDITEHRRAEAELKRHRDHLEEMVRERTDQLVVANAQLQADITERRRMEEDLRRAKVEWERTFDSVPDLIAILDTRHRIVRVNRAMAERLGARPEDCVGMNCFSCVHDASAPHETCPHALTLRDGREHVAEIHEDRLGGDFVVSTTPLFDEQAQMAGAVHVARDITERKRFEEALRESEEQLGLFVEYAPAALAMFDNQMRYLRLSQRWRADYGLGDRELRGVSHYDIFPEITVEWKEAHRKGLAGEVLRREADRFERADGTVQWVRWEIRPWRDAEGKVGGILIFTEDLTQHIQAEEAFRRVEEEAFQRGQLRALAEKLGHAREEERKRVARDLHDDIGQLLTAIKMDLAWTKRHLTEAKGEVQDRLARSIEMVSNGAKTVRDICNDLRPGVLDDLGLSAAIEWQAKEFASRTGIDCDVTLPSTDLRVDSGKSTTVFRIFQECLTNVMRHAEAKSVRVSLRGEDGNLFLVVQDDGVGFRESSESNPMGSLGILGMNERAQACGGEVIITSSPGNGTTVTIRVPADAATVLGEGK